MNTTTDQRRHPVFVYGSLKRGFYNHHCLDGALLVGEAETAERFPLIPGTHYPFLVDEAGEGHRVKGEVYIVDDGGLARLDRLEGHPHYYRRRMIDVKLGEGCEPVEALAYFIQGRRPEGEPVEEWREGAA